MSKRPVPSLLLLAAVAFATGSTVAQTTTRGTTSRPVKADPHGIKMDALSRATLDRWEKMEYHLGRAGVKTMSFTVTVDAKSPMGEVQAKGTYSFDGKKSTLKWDNQQLGAMLAQRGWSRESFDRLLIADSHRRALKGAELTASKKDGTTILKVKGETRGGYKAFYYDANGIAQRFSMAVDDNMGGEVEAVISVTYDKVGKIYVRNGWSFKMQHPMGEFVGKVAIENKKVGKYHVYGTVEETMTMAGQPFGSQTLTFSDYKINGTITEKPAAKGKEKPTSRPGKDAPPGRPKATSRPKR